MSLVTVIWSMTAALCLTLGGVHFLVWLRVRELWANFFFAVSAIAAAVLALQEMTLMYAPSPEEYNQNLRWMQVSVTAVVIALVWFIRLHLQSGRVWLAWLITGLRVLILVPNFVIFPNATFEEIHSLNQVVFLGETLAAPVGETNPWRFLISMNSVLLLVYVIDAAVGAWKQGRRQRAVVVGSAVLSTIILAKVFSSLMVQGVVPGPFTGLVFTLIILAMAYELSVDLIGAKQLARDLEDSQKRMNLAARAANLGLWEWDIVRDDIWTNDAGRVQIGFNAASRINFDRYLASVHRDDRDALRQSVLRTLDSDRELQTEFRQIRPQGGTGWVAARGQVERDSQGKPLRLRGVSMDITERKRITDELRRQQDEFAHVQRVATLGQLSSALAHELNQPLGAILRNAEAGELFLRQEPPDLGELREILVDIQHDEQRAAAVIERMRSLLQRRELRFESIALDQLIGQITTLLQAEIQACHAFLQTDVPQVLPKVYGDRVQLQQVILNLVLNSLDALKSRPNPPRQVAIRAALAQGGAVELAVADNGPGIASAELPELFKPFFTTKSKGTGIGLAISKTIIESHGGHIWAENNADGGATVRFTVPVAKANDAA